MCLGCFGGLGQLPESSLKSIIHSSIHPFSDASLSPGCSGSKPGSPYILLPSHVLQLFLRVPEKVSRPDGICNPSRVFWACYVVFAWNTSRDSSKSNARTTTTYSFQYNNSIQWVLTECLSSLPFLAEPIQPAKETIFCLLYQWPQSFRHINQSL